MNKLKLNTKVRIKGNKGWGGFWGKIVMINMNKETAQIEIPALGKLYLIDFCFSEIKII